MKSLFCVALLLSVPTLRPAQHVSSPKDAVAAKPSRKGGQWYFAETGHAVYCYGPVMMVTQPDGGIQRVATFCRGDKTIVPLKD